MQEGPITDNLPHLVMTNEESPIKSLYKEIGDKFEAKVLSIATVHARKNLKFPNSNVHHTLTISMPQEEFDKFLNAYKSDEHFNTVLEAIHNTKDPMNPPFPQYQVGDNGLLYFIDSSENLRLCVPKSLQAEVTSEVHDSPSEAAHLGYHKTYMAIVSRYYWPKMARTIRKYVITCDTCQKTKPKRHGHRGYLTSIPTASQPGMIYTMDFIIDPTESYGYNGILVIVDKCTEYAHFL